MEQSDIKRVQLEKLEKLHSQLNILPARASKLPHRRRQRAPE